MLVIKAILEALRSSFPTLFVFLTSAIDSPVWVFGGRSSVAWFRDPSSLHLCFCHFQHVTSTFLAEGKREPGKALCYLLNTLTILYLWRLVRWPLSDVKTPGKSGPLLGSPFWGTTTPWKRSVHLWWKDTYPSPPSCAKCPMMKLAILRDSEHRVPRSVQMRVEFPVREFLSWFRRYAPSFCNCTF